MANETYRGVPFGRLNRTIGSSKMKFILPQDYNPAPKAPSRRDLHRASVRANLTRPS